jgi:uncharacterized protein YjbI with pentapeptide repeats
VVAVVLALLVLGVYAAFNFGPPHGHALTNTLGGDCVNDTPIDCSYAPLRYSDFSGLVLTGGNFTGSDLRNVNFNSADLENATFAGANLAKADFTDADLTGANLNGTNYSSAIYCDTIMPDGTINLDDCSQ